jgi:hypothetical protein
MKQTDKCFTSPEVYVLVRENATSGAPPFRGLLTNEVDGGSTVCCFLSYFHAMFSAILLRATTNIPWLPAKAGQFGIEAFRLGDGYAGYLHVGWIAHQGRLLMGTDCLPVAFGLPFHQSAGSNAQGFEVDRQILAMVDGLYEYAGLFAWRESCHDTDWDATRLGRVLARMGVSGAPFGSVEHDQYAFLNPDTGEWHFLSIDGPPLGASSVSAVRSRVRAVAFHSRTP